MNQLTDYPLAIRTTGSPSAPAGTKAVDLVPGTGDAVAAMIDALRTSGLTPADFRSRVIFLAPAGSGCLVPYAALCGFAGRRIDAYADGAILEFSRLGRDGREFPDAGMPPGHLAWAQVGGHTTAGIPTALIGPGAQGLVTPEAVTVIRYAARLRLVPPDSARDALAMFTLVAAIRWRGDDRFPYLSTGTEPPPKSKDDPDQGIDLERLRRAAGQYRQQLRVERGKAEIVPPRDMSAADRRLAEANSVDIRALLGRLGSSPGEKDHWRCPRPRRHRNGDENPSMKVYGENRVRCRRCDPEKLGPLRLVIDVLGVTVDEAATFILDSDRTVDLRAG
jgi:hypothetical protein